ncbi:MAG: Rieske 2Fe-2S domain-containing protein [Bacteroidia bacterium]|jgi:cytochrome b6-f complex iron-sulfur subunit
MDRKEFFSKALFGGGALFLAPAILSSCAKANVDPGSMNPTFPLVIDLNASAYSSLKTVGGYTYNGNVIIIRANQSSYIALSSVCTHQGCTVGYSSSANMIVCPCHGAQYNTGGSVLRGPAQQSLTSYKVSLSGTSMTIG